MHRFLFALLLTTPVFGQAAVEAGLGASRAATSTAPAKGLGKSMSGIAGSLDHALKPAQKEAEEAPSKTVAAAAVPSSKPQTGASAAKFEDAAGIEAGLPYADLVRRFGPPAMSMTFDAESSLSYSGKSGIYQVKVVAGKVKNIEKPQP